MCQKYKTVFKILTLLTILSALYFTLGCSSGTVTDTETVDLPNERALSTVGDSENSDVKNPEARKASVIFQLASSASTYIQLLPGWEYPITVEQFIEKGVMAVIPYDPVTGEGELLFTEEWHPGGCYFYDDGNRFVSKQHFIEYNSNYDAKLKESDGMVEYLPGLMTDGHSIFVEEEEEHFVTQQEIRSDPRYQGITDEQLWMECLDGQIRCIVRSYSMHYPDILYSLDDYLNWIGEKNPAAFINPYSGEPMKSLPPALGKDWEFSFDTDRLGFVKDPDPQEYAGNYSEFIDLVSHDYESIVFQFYYINPDGELAVTGVAGTPRRLHRQGIMKGFGMEYEGD